MDIQELAVAYFEYKVLSYCKCMKFNRILIPKL